MITLSEFREFAPKITVMTLLSIPIYAYLTFYFVYPIICPFPIGLYGSLFYMLMLYAFLVAVGIGMVMNALEHGIIVVILGTMFGYVLALIYQGFPAYLYGYTLYTSDIMIMGFIEKTWLLPFIFILFGIPGLLIGETIMDRIKD